MINGLNVVDATKPVIINISDRDVASGDKKSPDGCAAAKCAVRTIANCTDARIHLSRCYLRIGNRYYRYLTSPSLKLEIVAFDRGGKFMAGEYVLNAPPKSQRKGYKRPGGKVKTQGRRRRRLHVTQDVRDHIS